jgi:ribosome-associated heat shock protein Hsp15
VRIDKWLWAARFFKTRALAARACDLGRVQAGTQDLKPSRELRPGDRLRISTDGGIYEVEVLALSDIRGPAAVAQTLYHESEESRQARLQAAAARKALGPSGGAAPPGRPSKRDRRRILRFRGDGR